MNGLELLLRRRFQMGPFQIRDGVKQSLQEMTLSANSKNINESVFLQLFIRTELDNLLSFCTALGDSLFVQE